MINPYAAGAKVYRGGSSAATMGTVDPMGYIERGMRQRMANVGGGSLLANMQSPSQMRSGLAAAALRRQQGMPVGTPTPVPDLGLTGPPTPQLHGQFNENIAYPNPIVNGQPTHEMQAPTLEQQITHTHPINPQFTPSQTSAPIASSTNMGGRVVQNPTMPELTGPVGYSPQNLQSQIPVPNETGHITISDILNHVNLGRVNNIENQTIPGMNDMQLAAVRKAFPWFGEDLSNPQNRQQTHNQISGLRKNTYKDLSPEHFAQMLKNAGEGDYLDLINQARQSGTPMAAYQELMNALPEQRQQEIGAVNDTFSKVFPILSHIAKRQLMKGVT